MAKQQINQKQSAPTKLGYAQVTVTQGSITNTETAITGLSVTVNAPGGRDVRITGYLWPNSTVAGDIIRQFVKEGATYHGSQTMQLPAASFGFNQMAQIVIPAPSAGSHTYNITLQRIGGSGTIASNAGTPSAGNTPAYVLVELL